MEQMGLTQSTPQYAKMFDLALTPTVFLASLARPGAASTIATTFCCASPVYQDRRGRNEQERGIHGGAGPVV